MNKSNASTDTDTQPTAAKRAAEPRLALAGNATGQSETTAATPHPASHAIRLLCVDDHAVLVEGLRAQFAIAGKIEVVGRLSSATKLLDEVARLQPHGVLLDIEMPGPDAFEIADRLTRQHPRVRVMMLSAHVRDAFISASFAAGASAYFAKSDDLDDISAGIIEVMGSKTRTFVLSPKVRERCRPVIAGSKNRATVGGTSEGPDVPVTKMQTLTGRESEILRLIGKGLSRHQIATQLSRSVKTVDGHQDRLMKKLGITSRSDLMRLAIREGFAQA